MAQITFWQCSARHTCEMRLPGEESPEGCAFLGQVDVQDGHIAVLQEERWRQVVVCTFGYIYNMSYSGGKMALGHPALETLEQPICDAAKEARSRDGR
jgi:hypothetical protein